MDAKTTKMADLIEVWLRGEEPMPVYITTSNGDGVICVPGEFDLDRYAGVLYASTDPGCIGPRLYRSTVALALDHVVSVSPLSIERRPRRGE